MIKFFRKIRQNLLSEGKTGKYVKYAIGEIVLVMIGILLALQVNNWNENRKNLIALDSYSKLLINDLQQDTIRINSILEFVKDDLSSIKVFSQRLSSHNATKDTLIKIARNEFNPLFLNHTPPNNKTLMAIRENGLLKYFDDTTNSLILDLETLQSMIESNINLTTMAYLDQQANMASKYGVNGMYIIEGSLAENAWKDIDTTDLLRTIDGTMSMKKLLQLNIESMYTEQLKMTVNLIQQLINIQRKK